MVLNVDVAGRRRRRALRGSGDRRRRRRDGHRDRPRPSSAPLRPAPASPRARRSALARRSQAGAHPTLTTTFSLATKALDTPAGDGERRLPGPSARHRRRCRLLRPVSARRGRRRELSGRNGPRPCRSSRRRPPVADPAAKTSRCRSTTSSPELGRAGRLRLRHPRPPSRPPRSRFRPRRAAITCASWPAISTKPRRCSPRSSPSGESRPTSAVKARAGRSSPTRPPAAPKTLTTTLPLDSVGRRRPTSRRPRPPLVRPPAAASSPSNRRSRSVPKPPPPIRPPACWPKSTCPRAKTPTGWPRHS